LHASVVHALPSSAQPAPLAALFVTQVLAWQTCVAQAESTPQSAFFVQPTHFPAPSHWSAPPQLDPTAVAGWLTTPPVQTSVVQRFPSSGMSVSSTTIWGPPCPSQVTFMQSPTAPPPGSPIPLSVYTVEHTLVAVLHVNVVHAVAVPQSPSVVQAQLPAPSHESCRVGPHAVPLGVAG
jgi:hypothetical protein